MDTGEKIKAVQRMQDYIEKNIDQAFTLCELAREAGYSPWHSTRIFREMTDKTPFEYIRALRLSKAALRLKSEDVRIIDVALDFHFGTHEGFTRAFSRHFGMTPADFKKNKQELELFMPSQIRDYYIKKQKGEGKMSEKSGTRTIFVQVVDRPLRKLILKRGIKATHYFEYCEEAGCEIWNILSGIEGALYEPIGMWLPEKFRRPGTSVYAQGVEVPHDYTGEIPDGFEMMELPACKMMVFQGPPFKDEEFMGAIEELWEEMKKYNPQLYGFKWADDDGPRFQLAPLGYRGYMEARPVRTL